MYVLVVVCPLVLAWSLWFCWSIPFLSLLYAEAHSEGGSGSKTGVRLVSLLILGWSRSIVIPPHYSQQHLGFGFWYWPKCGHDNFTWLMYYWMFSIAGFSKLGMTQRSSRTLVAQTTLCWWGSDLNAPKSWPKTLCHAHIASHLMYDIYILYCMDGAIQLCNV